MKTKEIIDGNKLIAEFMGGKYDKDTNFPIHPDDIWLPFHGIVNATSIGYGRGRTILYHSSWDWLIPVIDKITDMKEYKTYKDTGGQLGRELYINTKFIISTWENVINFINWYNQNK